MGFLSTVLYNIRQMKRAKNLRSMSIEDILLLDDEELYDAIDCVCTDAIDSVSDMTAPELNEVQKYVYSLLRFEAEVNNGGLCQFFVNSSSVCAPYISAAMLAIGATELKMLFDNFIIENQINVNDLSSFKIDSLEEYEAQTERFDFDSFDDKFYESYDFHQQIIDYARKHIEQIMK